MEQRLATPLAVRSVEAASITFAPAQPTGRHRHPVPMVGVVTAGSFVFQIAGHPARILHQGEAFYEPKNTIIERLDNASAQRPASITAFYLVDRVGRPLIEMVPW